MASLRDLGAADRDDAAGLWERCGLVAPWNDPGADLDRALRNPASKTLGLWNDGALIATTTTGYEGHRGWI